VKVGSVPVKLDKYYTVACPDYIAKGNEEYDMLAKAERIVDYTNCPLLFDIIKRFFMLIFSKEFEIEKKMLF
jgi:2',3'-cyclic-nucleotide 2'-phosphodiesterase (5'-nucleotidase family)